MTDLHQLRERVREAASLHERIANEVPEIARGLVYCRTCERVERVNGANCLRGGWPKCCGQTMTIDVPADRAPTDREG